MKRLDKEKAKALENLYSSAPSSQVWESIAQGIMEEKKQKKKSFLSVLRPYVWNRYAMAASILLFMGIGLWIQLYNDADSSDARIVAEATKAPQERTVQPVVTESVQNPNPIAKEVSAHPVIKEVKNFPVKRIQKTNDSNQEFIVAAPDINKESSGESETIADRNNIKVDVIDVLPTAEFNEIAVAQKSVKNVANIAPTKNTIEARSDAKSEIKLIDQLKENAVAFLSNKVSELGEELNIKNSRKIKSIEIIY